MYFCLNRGTAGGSIPQDQFVRLSAAAGFQGADVDFGYAVAHGAAALEDLYQINNQRYGGWSLGDWRHDPTTAAAELTKLDFHAAVAAKLKVDSCATWIMPSSDLSLAENQAFHIDRLGAAARVLAAHGLRLGLEFVSPLHLRRRHKNEFVYTATRMLELAADIGPNVGLLIDVFHLYAAGESIDRAATLDDDQIVLVHLNDAPAGALADVDDGKRLLPGEGVIDQTSFLKSIAASGYIGPVSVEVFNDALRVLPPEQAADRAWTATRRVAQASGVL